MNLDYFDYCTGLTMTNSRFHELFGGRPRHPEDRITERDANLAASVQTVLDEVVLRMTRAIAVQTGLDNLCLAGGVALNCVTNGKILRDGFFRRIWIQPASGDAGGALGAALAVYHLHLKSARAISSRAIPCRAHFSVPSLRRTTSSGVSPVKVRTSLAGPPEK